MNAPSPPEGAGSSTRPYLIRALHEWCTDNGFTPYLAVHVDETVQVPAEYVKNGEIVLNVGFEATSALQMSNEFVSFKARFGGVARDIVVPVDRVVAIYARENGQGMAFPLSAPARTAAAAPAPPGPVVVPVPMAPAPAAPGAVEPDSPDGPADPSGPARPGRPSAARRAALTRIK